MSAPPFMPLYVADYLGDTTHLTVTEHGAYLLLLMAMWRADGRLPADPKKLARFAKMTVGQWNRSSDTIMAFFRASDGWITHTRMAAERTRYAGAVEQQRHRSSNGGRAKALKYNNRPPAGGTQKTCQPEPEPDSKVFPLTGEKDLRGERSLSPPNGDAPSPEERAEIGRQMMELARELRTKRA